MINDIKTILSTLGFSPLVKDGNYYRTKAIYRGGDNPTALRISSRSGYFTDFPAGLNGPFPLLIQMVLGLKTTDDAKSWLSRNEFEFASLKSEDSPLIEKSRKYYNPNLLDKLIKNNSYWNNRGISDNILNRYKGGIALSGTMSQRYVIPIFDENERILGFAGRDITGKNALKWILIGQKQNWVFPSKNIKYIKEKSEVILVESFGDSAALEEAGINTSLILFGVVLNDSILSKLAGLNPNKIIIALNNDSQKNNVGNDRSKDVEKRLLQFFNPEKIQIKLPEYGDFNDILKKDGLEGILNWYNS